MYTNVKKIVATLLVLTMVLTQCSVMFTAFAAENESPPKEEMLYKVSLQSENGDISFEDSKETEKSFKKGDKVKVKLNPNKGYEFESLSLYQVTEEEKEEIKKTSKKSKTFTFTMPNSDLEVKATFKNKEKKKEESKIKKQDDKEYFDTVTAEEKVFEKKKEAPY